MASSKLSWTHKETMAALQEVTELIPSVIRNIREMLYELHGVEYSDTYLQIVHGFWAEHVCHELIYLHSQNFDLSGLEHYQIQIPVNKPPYPTPKSVFMTRHQIIGLLNQNPDFVTNVRFTMAPREGRVAWGRRAVADALLGLMSPSAAPVSVVNPYLPLDLLQRLYVAQQTRGKIRWRNLGQLHLPAVPPNIEVRRTFLNIGNRSASESVIRSLVALTLPVDLAENLPQIEHWASSGLHSATRFLYTANAQHYQVPFKVLAALHVSRGGHLLIHQHGGGYGIDSVHAGERYDRSIANRFYTFGWTEVNANHEIRPLPTPPRAQVETTSSHYLLMSLEHIEEFFRLQSFFLPEHAETCVRETLDFISLLRGPTTVRLRSAPAAPFPVERISHSSCALSLAPGAPSGPTLASQARLVIHNYLGTSWLETLAMNVPTVCFYDPTIFAPRESAQPFIEALASVGVVHHSGADAAKFVNGFRGDPSSWWNSAEVQEAREAFVARYANFSENWLEAWQTEFESLLAE